MAETWQASLGGLRLSVEHRRGPGGEGGPTLRVRDTDGREWLRFDCFEREPHYHFDPEGRDEIHGLDPLADNVAWVVAELSRDLRALLDKAGCSVASDWNEGEVACALAGAEAALRNPPARLDDLDLDVLHARLSEKWNTYPPDVLPAWVAEMDFPLAEPIRLVLQRAVERWDVGYPIAPKDTGLAEAFAEHVAARFDWEISPRRVEILADVVQGMHIALETFSEKGDGAIVQTPIYPPFLQTVNDTGRRLVENRLVLGDAGFEIDFDSLARDVDDQTRVFFLCNPHNPSGRVFSRDELQSLAELCVQRDLVVVANEIHADLVYAGREHIPFATLGPEIAERTITLTSATKAYNIPGLRCAVAHFGSVDLMRRFNAHTQRHVRGGLGLLGLYATIAAWRHSRPWLEQVLAYLDSNRRFLESHLPERFPAIRFHRPEGTYLAWLDFRAYELPTTPAVHLMKHGRVALTDGHFFGRDLEGFARLNFATSRAILEQVLDRVDVGLRAAGPR